jgi:hypothetical protein
VTGRDRAQPVAGSQTSAPTTSSWNNFHSVMVRTPAERWWMRASIEEHISTHISSMWWPTVANTPEPHTGAINGFVGCYVWLALCLEQCANSDSVRIG